MSDKFNEREQGYEAKFRLDQELEFKARSRRNKLFGLWLAEKLGMTEQEADAYAKTVVAADLEEPGDADVIRKVTKDLEERNLEISEGEIVKQLDHFYSVARKEMEGEAP
jgi:hypothetical protein